MAAANSLTQMSNIIYSIPGGNLQATKDQAIEQAKTCMQEPLETPHLQAEVLWIQKEDLFTKWIRLRIIH